MDTRFREIEVAGTSLEMGQQIGEAAREEIRGFAAIALERVNKTIPVSRANALAACRDSIPYVEGYAPDMLDELRGMSESSGVSLEEMVLLQIRNQLRPDEDAGCTSFSIAPETGAASGAMVGQNWDNDPALDPLTVVLTRRPLDKPAMMDVTQAGLIAYIGMNDRGVGLCMNTLPAPNRRVGVPHYFVVRGIYETDNLDDAVGAVRRAHRAIPNNLMLATPQGPADLEITVDDVHVLRANGAGMVCHTNHCLHPDLLPINDEFPELIQSNPRLARIERLFEKAGQPLGLEGIQEALRNHEDFPTSLCRHANEHPTNGFWVTVLSVIIEPEGGCMHISRGNPCEKPYETYRLN